MIVSVDYVSLGVWKHFLGLGRRTEEETSLIPHFTAGESCEFMILTVDERRAMQEQQTKGRLTRFSQFIYRNTSTSSLIIRSLML